MPRIECAHSIRRMRGVPVLTAQNIKIKPILFNTEMVKAILDGRKTVTRRVVNIPTDIHCVNETTDHEFVRDDIEGFPYTGFVCKKCGFGVSFPHSKYPVGTSFIRPHYQVGDILYVRETWKFLSCSECEFFEQHEPVCLAHIGCYVYKADDNIEISKWRPSIHMPKEAARIFLLATGVFIQRIQDITDDQVQDEGCKDRDDFARVWNECYASPQPVKEDGVIIRYESYPWEDIQETRTYRGLPWIVIGNPWVCATEFKRISKSDATKETIIGSFK